jgi:hypothetical protein
MTTIQMNAYLIRELESGYGSVLQYGLLQALLRRTSAVSHKITLKLWARFISHVFECSEYLAQDVIITYARTHDCYCSLAGRASLKTWFRLDQ